MRSLLALHASTTSLPELSEHAPLTPSGTNTYRAHIYLCPVSSVQYQAGDMNQTADIARDILANPPKEVVDIMGDPRTSNDARAAISEISPSPLLANPITTSNGTGAATRSAALPINKAGEGRLQVVDENQNFTYVQQGPPRHI